MSIAWLEVRQNFENYVEMKDEVNLLEFGGMSFSEVYISNYI